MSRAPAVKAPTDRGTAILIGAGLTSAGLVTVLSPALAPLAIAMGTVVVTFGVRNRLLARAVVRTHAALQAITRGRIEDAEAQLDAIPSAFTKSGSVMRSVVHQRALIAFYRNDAARAVAVIEPATSPKVKRATQGYEHMQRTIALSLRALALASMGDFERARADAAEVLGSEHSTPESLARSHLAEAVVLARTGAMTELAAHFRAHGSLILEHAYPRERVLARALRKMVQSRTRSVYREAARPEEERRPTGAIGEWIATIAPDAAAHATDAARLAERSEAIATPAVSDEDLRVAKDARAEAARASKPPKRLRRAAALVAFAGVVSWAAMTLLEPTGGGSPEPPASFDATLAAFGLIVVVFFVAAVVRLSVASRRVRQRERDMLAAQRALALGDAKTADPLLAVLERTRHGLSAAQAWFMRAKHAEREARFGDCVDLCNLALGSVSAQDVGHRILASMALTPSIAALRGLALAALGRTAEASGELGTIARDHATWSHRASSELRVRLMIAVKTGDLDAARAVARERTPELPITLRDETLGDLVLAVAPEGASRDEQERVDTEIREDQTIRTWIDAVAPDLRNELARRVSAKPVRIEVSSEEEEDELVGESASGARARLSSSS